MQQIFMLPAGQAKDAFNTTVFNKGEAVSNYETLSNDNLADIETVLAALAVPGLGGNNRAALYPRDLEDFLIMPVQTREESALYRVVEGKSEIHGWGLVVMQAAGPGGKPANLYAIEDKKTSRMVIVGPAAIEDDFRVKLEKNGVTYVARGETGAAGKVDTFLAEGAKWRGERGQLPAPAVSGVIETLIKAIVAVASPDDHHPGGPLWLVRKGTTIGNILTRMNDAEASVYTKIRKPKRPAWENLPP